MFFLVLFGTKWMYKKIEDGLVLEKKCSNCGEICDFFEVVPTNYFTLFWIPIFSIKKESSLLECSNCSSKFYMKDEYKEENFNDEKEQLDMYLGKGFLYKCIKCNNIFRIPFKKKEAILVCENCKDVFKMKNGRIIFK